MTCDWLLAWWVELGMVTLINNDRRVDQAVLVRRGDVFPGQSVSLWSHTVDHRPTEVLLSWIFVAKIQKLCLTTCEKREWLGKYFLFFCRVIDLQCLKEGQRLYCMGWERLPPSLPLPPPPVISIPPSATSFCSPLIFHSFSLLPLPSSLWHTELKCHHYPALWLASIQTPGEPSSTATRQLELPAHNAPQRTADAPPPPAATAQFFVLLSFCYLSQAD